ncbi:MAG: threonine--tRNA ligase [Bacteroidales bacterium]|jgi:threonyl-tRNA synthetase|nr:threonine--tRNA ligase [Bacteroidales bacterium]MDI9576010.1 threonine--tRNA ligase [Bacteroidota bacterium]MDD3755527.1 threonine--tRNA ligase [Bacteroidales bacterium]MDY0400686.1 threonine--tRNA ligase [Bacteroidales bacterium]HHW60027.1 threonine--tRNA ligase [Bacteroidales bacterium]
MKDIVITFSDNSKKIYPAGITGMDIAQSISQSLAREALAIKVNDTLLDLERPIESDAKIQILTWEDREGKEVFWHSSAHIMAAAVFSLFPHVKFGIGPSIEQGFYYDIDFGDYKITEDDIEKIENKAKDIIKQDLPFIRKEITKAEAINLFEKSNDTYKLELIQELENEQITLYCLGEYIDLCRGPHLPSTKYVKTFKLLNIAGAYWRGDEHRQMLTRIYGISFPSKKLLDDYLTFLEEAKKRDHRKLGKELELFMFNQKVGQGLPMWLPKGTIVREELEKFLKKIQIQYGYQHVITPHIGQKELYMTSGHYEKYAKDSFRPISTPNENEEFMLKPMNCPHHCEIYAFKPRSYKDLPLRIAEFGTVYRYEQSGELHGLTRVRSFTQDDAHIFCTNDQLNEEFHKVMEIVLLILNTFDFKNFTAQVSLRDPDNKEKYIGTDENWDKAEEAILESVANTEFNIIIAKGEAAFYGPKLDFMVQDAIGRSWQLGTIQVDYNLPERFNLEYIGPDNQKYRPVMIHRAIFGSMERFVSLLLEQTAGKLPLWLAPVQVIVLPISEKYIEYGKKVVSLLSNFDVRTEMDDRSEKIGKKIRDAELEHIPYMLIVGEKEQNDNALSVRRQGIGDIGVMPIESFMNIFSEEINKSLTNKN